ncbi:GGDEF domain-containing protein [Sulfurimonas sp. HSL-1716]|uniref:GGDEF domain-containing protein n=1 Tax=Hydrocurvibacter sulfurireducens TaxID=3131937 RepID=UPI0031F958F7
MQTTLTQTWLDRLDLLDIAFQPILNIHTGKIYAVEALLRNVEDAGFKSIFSLFDKVYKEGILYPFDIKLREIAFEKFTTIPGYKEIKLFYNLDNRLFEIKNYSHGNTKRLLEQFDISKDNICFEISERHEITQECDITTVLKHYQDEDFCIAIDDFGVGHSGYKLLYESTPNVIKIDRFFLSGIETNMKKKLLVRNITNLAVQFGIKVIAEGVETKEELLTCKDIGCHYIQGYLIQRPTLNAKEIKPRYEEIVEILKSDKRAKDINSQINAYIDRAKPFDIKTKTAEVLKYLKENPNISIMPIVNSLDEPMGILQDKEIKNFLYSPYGMSLLNNDFTQKTKLKNLMTPCGTADINSDISTIIELFSNNPESVGILITKNSKYVGFLSARAIITIMNEQNLIFAREQNPLTKLPGNMAIDRYLAGISDDNCILCYFDLDNFKAYNDNYGFRNGDRVIMLFADILKQNLPGEFFKAHIGGDDFFVAVKFHKNGEIAYVNAIKEIIEKFSQDVKAFYSQEDLQRGYIVAKDRECKTREFALLSVSASVIVIKTKTKRDLESINMVLSFQKKIAKNDNTKICISSLL